jgi:hypothetical protein
MRTHPAISDHWSPAERTDVRGCGRAREVRQYVHPDSGPFAPEALDFLETKGRVQTQGGNVVRPDYAERLVRAVEDPAQTGPRQRSGDTPAPPRRVHENATEIADSRSSRRRLICRQLGHPSVGDYLAVRLRARLKTQVVAASAAASWRARRRVITMIIDQ